VSFKVGDRFGQLLVLQVLPLERVRAARMLLCLCSCGKRKVIRASNLRPGPNGVKGCGCGRRLRWHPASDPASAPEPVTVMPVEARTGRYPPADDRKANRLRMMREVARRLKALDAQVSQ
jgi:hypothetical protein